MSQKGLVEIIERSVADYGFRLAVIWGTDDVVTGFQLTPGEARTLTESIVPQLQKLPNPVEPADQPTIREHLAKLLP